MTNNTTTSNEEMTFEVQPITNKFVIWYGYLWRWWYSTKMSITRPFRLRKLRKQMRREPILITPKH